jgi:hypothetical protein
MPLLFDFFKTARTSGVLLYYFAKTIITAKILQAKPLRAKQFKMPIASKRYKSK